MQTSLNQRTDSVGDPPPPQGIEPACFEMKWAWNIDTSTQCIISPSDMCVHTVKIVHAQTNEVIALELL